MLPSEGFSMTVTRIALLSVSAAAVAGWLTAASAPDNEVRTPVVDRHVPRDPGDALAAEIDRLHARVSAGVVPVQPSRNLFKFASTAADTVEVVESASGIERDDEGAPPSLNPTPVLRLIGMAEDQGVNGPERTAILSGGGQLFFVTEGQEVAGFTVSRLSGEVVELVGLDGTILRLALP